MKKLTILITVFFVFLVLGSFAQAQITSQRQFVVIVLDCSGSMEEDMGNTDIMKLNAVKQALKEVVAQLPDNSYVGLLTFSAANVSDDWIYPLQPLNKSKLMSAIDKPQPGGGTPLGRYMKIGADALLKERAARHNYYDIYRLLVVTDGQAGDEDKVEAYTPDIKRKGIRLDVIGVDMKTDHILSNMAHTYRSANNPDVLKEEIAQVFSELSGDAFENGEDPYQLIAGLSDSMAIAMIQGITEMDNTPIGERSSLELEPTGTTANNSSKTVLLFVFLVIIVIFLLFLLAAL
jgi:uncharacterized protein YegL